MTKSLRATFEKLHPRSGRFYDAETNRYFSLSKQAGDTGKRVDSDSQQFWEFYQLCFGALQGELDEAIAQVAMLRTKAIEIRQLLYEYNNSFMSSHEYDAKLKPLVNNLIDLALTDSSTAQAHDTVIWEEGWVAGRDAAIEACEFLKRVLQRNIAELKGSKIHSENCRRKENEGNSGGVDYSINAIRALTPPTDNNGSGE